MCRGVWAPGHPPRRRLLRLPGAVCRVLDWRGVRDHRGAEADLPRQRGPVRDRRHSAGPRGCGPSTPRGGGGGFPVPRGAEVWGGYWVVPLCLALGLAVLVVTHRCARRFLSWWRERRVRGGVATGGFSPLPPA